MKVVRRYSSIGMSERFHEDVKLGSRIQRMRRVSVAHPVGARVLLEANGLTSCGNPFLDTPGASVDLAGATDLDNEVARSFAALGKHLAYAGRHQNEPSLASFTENGQLDLSTFAFNHILPP